MCLRVGHALEVVGFVFVGLSCMFRFFLVFNWGICLGIGVVGFFIYLLSLKILFTHPWEETQKHIYKNNLIMIIPAILLSLYQPTAFVIGALIFLIALVIVIRSSIKDTGPIPRNKTNRYSPITGF